MEKIDPESTRRWEQSLTSEDMSKHDELRLFLIRRCQALESMGNENVKKNKNSGSMKNEEVPTAVYLFFGESKEEGNFCGKPHNIKECRKDSSLSYEEMKPMMDKRKSCILCLKTGNTEAYEPLKMGTELMSTGKFELRWWEHAGDVEGIHVLPVQRMKWDKASPMTRVTKLYEVLQCQ